MENNQIMNPTQLKTDLHNLIDKVNDTNLLNAIKEILSKQVNDVDFWDDLPLSVRESIKKGMVQAENGQTKGHSEVMKKYDKWLLK